MQKPASPKPPQENQTPVSSRAVRRAQKAYKLQPSTELLSLIFRANEKLASQCSILLHERNGLIGALQLEKAKRKRGKKLNLLGEEDSGPQFWSPSKVQAAKGVNQAKEAEELQKKADIADRKAKAAATKRQKELDKAARAHELAVKRAAKV